MTLHGSPMLAIALIIISSTLTLSMSLYMGYSIYMLVNSEPPLYTEFKNITVGDTFKYNDKTYYKIHVNEAIADSDPEIFEPDRMVKILY